MIKLRMNKISGSKVFLPLKVYASEITLSCINNKTGFSSIYKLNTSKYFKSAKHISSYNPKTKQKYSINSDMRIIDSKEDYLATIDYSQNDRVITFQVFNLDSKTMTSSGHYLDSEIEPYPQKFSCY